MDSLLAEEKRIVPLLEGLVLRAMLVTRAGMSSALLLYRSPEQTLLLPPSTAHRPESAPASDTEPAQENHDIFTITGLLVQSCVLISS